MRIDWRFGKKKKEEADAHSDVDIEQPADTGLATDAEPAETPSIDTVIDTSNTSDDVPGIFTPEPSNPSTLVVRSGSASNKGMHARNEDCVKDGWWCSCFVVSDGIGGAPDGDYMSRVACGAVVESYEESHDIERAFSFGNVAAITVSKWIDSPDCGATLLVAGLEGDDLTCAWCGDSVAYRLRDGGMLLLTEPERKAGTNVLESAIGYTPDQEPQIAKSKVLPADRFLLCTDGVWSVFAKEDRLPELAQLISCGDNAPLIASRICDEARKTGTDDASAIVIIIADDTADDEADKTAPIAAPIEHTPPPTVAAPDIHATMAAILDKTEAADV